MRLRKMILLLLVILSFASVALSLPTSSSDTEWYSDDTYYDVVGGRSISCSGAVYSWGVRTNWYTVYSESCNGGGGYCQSCSIVDGYTYCTYLC